jgi:hypothetical protein
MNLFDGRLGRYNDTTLRDIDAILDEMTSKAFGMPPVVFPFKLPLQPPKESK